MTVNRQHRQPVEQTRLRNVAENIPEHEKRCRMVAAEIKQASASQEIEAAYAEFTKTTEGTPEYDQALGRFILLLFPKNGPH
jgi:hypothetical protein